MPAAAADSGLLRWHLCRRAPVPLLPVWAVVTRQMGRGLVSPANGESWEEETRAPGAGDLLHLNDKDFS